MRIRRLAVAAAGATTPVLLLLGLSVAVPPVTTAQFSFTPVACSNGPWQPSDPAFAALPGAQALSGSYDGGLYRIEIPGTWNGELVLVAHGYRAETGAQGSTLRVPTDPIRQHLIDGGFAWAASSFRCNGYVPGQALVDTMALRDLFTKLNGGRTPRRTYLTGTSMGGHVTLLGMHEFPTAFDGALAMCASGPALFDYFGAVSAAAEVVTGVKFGHDSLEADIATMATALGRPPNYTDAGRQLASIEILLSGGPRPFAMEGLAPRFIANATTAAPALAGEQDIVFERALTNVDTTYAIDPGLGLSAADLNARVRRKAADPAIRNANGPYREVLPFSGKIQRPVMTMHGTGDLFVPIFLERMLKQAVTAAGRANLLTQRIYRIAGHCGFSEAEEVRAFDDLVAWVRTGAKPAGDNVDGDLSNAGTTFTDPRRPGDPGGMRIR
jgi:alpha-beta hydrolase superfamily lysophospholipase